VVPSLAPDIRQLLALFPSFFLIPIATIPLRSGQNLGAVLLSIANKLLLQTAGSRAEEFPCARGSYFRIVADARKIVERIERENITRSR
jgi:hypothetical protein